MNLFFKLAFYLKGPPLLVVLARSNSQTIEFLSVLIKGRIKGVKVSPRKLFPILGKRIILTDISEETLVPSDIIFLFKRSSSPILIINKRRADRNIFKDFPERGLIIADTETARSLKNDGIAVESVGFDNRSDLWASDLNIGNETNFKINHGGDSVPFWIGRRLEKEEILEILLAVRTGMALGINLVQISQNLKR